MNEVGAAEKRYAMAVQLLPEELRQAAVRLACSDQKAAEEFRLRRGQPLSVRLPEREQRLPTPSVTGKMLQTVIDRATEFSAYRSAESIRRGYLPVRGGFRIGLCGTAVQRGGEIATLQELSSVAIRIAKEVVGAAESLYPKLFWDGQFESVLLIAPPGGGKTTLLRDLIRCLSEGDEKHSGLRVSVVDERGEIAAVHGGEPQFQIGRQTDVLTAVSKAEGISMLLRTMTPQVIAVDEITDPKDLQAMTEAANCGVSFLATVHGRNLAEIQKRRLCCALLETEVFHHCVILERREGKRQFRVETW